MTGARSPGSAPGTVTRAQGGETAFGQPRPSRMPAALHAEVHRPGAASRLDAERSVEGAGFPLPLGYRDDAARSGAALPSTLIVVRDSNGGCHGALAVETRQVNVPPGHRVARVERLGASLAPEAVGCAVDALLALVESDPRMLRLNAELFSRDPSVRTALSGRLRSAGFERSATPNCYAATLVIDLAPDIESLFSSLERSARRNIRAVAKHPVEVRPIDEPALEARMNELVREALARTGGTAHTRPWGEIMRYSRANPSRSRLVGFFRTDVSGPESLVAFAWGRSHGDHVEYADSGSIRPADLRIALSYALVWDLIVWARENGASWFDLGGVTRGTNAGGDDPLGGISDFKRFFSDEVAEVGEEWVFTPRTVRARLARAAHARVVGLREARAERRARPVPEPRATASAYPQPRASALASRRGDMADLLREFDSLHSSGAEALYATLRALSGRSVGGQRPIVWLPAYHCGVEVQAALDAGYDTGFYRVGPDLAVDADDLRARLASRPGTVVLIHYFGFAQPAATQVDEVCAAAGVALVDDCAHSLLTPIRRSGSASVATVYSLQKYLPVFDGGAVRVEHDTFARHARATDAPAWSSRRAPAPHHRPYVVAAKRTIRALLGESLAARARRALGSEAPRLTNPATGAPASHPSIPPVRRHGRGMSLLSRLLGGAESVAGMRSRRRENYRVLASALAGGAGYSPVFPSLPDDTVPLVLPVRVRDRGAVTAKLEAAGISPYIFGEYPHPTFRASDYPDASRLATEIIGLPVQHQLDAAEMRRIAGIIAPILAEDAAEHRNPA